MDTHEGTRKNDQINSEKDAPRHHPNKKKVQKNREKEEDKVEGPRMNEDRPENRDDAQESDKERNIQYRL